MRYLLIIHDEQMSGKQWAKQSKFTSCCSINADARYNRVKYRLTGARDDSVVSADFYRWQLLNVDETNCPANGVLL